MLAKNYIPHPFTPESDPGLKWTEDMVCVSSSSLCSERVVSGNKDHKD